MHPCRRNTLSRHANPPCFWFAARTNSASNNAPARSSANGAESWAASDHETIDASVNNSGEALSALAQLREALQTLPFFGSAKVVWLQNCNFLGEERTAAAAAVTEALADLAQELKSFRWD